MLLSLSLAPTLAAAGGAAWRAAPATAPTTFITIGDWGGMALGSYHATTTTAVAKQMAATAADAGAAFIVNTGDNFYYCGITSTSDKQIETDFTGPYGPYPSLSIPWYGSLGNHEYGYDVDAQIELSQTLSNWVLPARYYTKRIALGGTGQHHLTLVVLDTSPCVAAYRSSDPSGWDPCGSDFPTCDPGSQGPCKFHKNILGQQCGEQFTWFKAQLAAVPKGDWLIVVGHHPADEIDIEDFGGAMEAHGFDLYLNGHVHTLTQYSINGNGAYVTSGAGAMVHTRDQQTPIAQGKLTGRYNATVGPYNKTVATVWNQKVAGFTLHTFSDDYTSLRTEYITYEGKVAHSFETKKGVPPSPTPPQPSTCDVGTYPCARGCTYVHKASEVACGVTSYGCYDCAKLEDGCPECKQQMVEETSAWTSPEHASE